jgi:hypothetical protein
MTVSLTDRTTAGNAYAAALSTFITTYVELAATERALRRQGADSPGGRFGSETGLIDLIPFRHPQFAPKPDAPRLEDQIQARLIQL